MKLREGLRLADYGSIWVGLGGVLLVLQVGPAIGATLAGSLGVTSDFLVMLMEFSSGFVLSGILALSLMIYDICHVDQGD